MEDEPPEFDLDAMLDEEEEFGNDFGPDEEEFDEPEIESTKSSSTSNKITTTSNISTSKISDTKSSSKILLERSKILNKDSESDIVLLRKSIENSGKKNNNSNSSIMRGGPDMKSFSKLTTASLHTQKMEYETVKSSSFLHDSCVGMEKHTVCTLSNGSQFFLKRRAPILDTSSSLSARNTIKTHLLSKSISELREINIQLEAEEKAKQSLYRQKLEQHQNANGSTESNNMTSDMNFAITIEEMEKQRREQAIHDTSDLWVQKYSPNAFYELLSPERTNREVLKALKTWDSFVFQKKPIGAKPGPISSTIPGNATLNKHVTTGLSEDGRPVYKVILLSGPPGTGKTTLAHVVAKHCGYRVREVNASDENSPEIIRDIMSRAMNNTLDMNVTVGSSKDNKPKPNCIILDEIDGMENRSSIETLVSIVKAPLHKEKNANEKEKGKKGKSKARNNLVLSRPLICICNDQFAPALRELRKVAKIFSFQAPTEARLVQRLKAICVGENMEVSTSALSSLGSTVGQDIRSALNTLQFASLKLQQQKQEKMLHGEKTPSSGDISRILNQMIRSGLKDAKHNIFDIWRQVFSQREASSAHQQSLRDEVLQSSKSSIGKGGNEDRAIARWKGATFLSKTIAAYGDHSLVLRGIQENMLSARVTDPSGCKMYGACEWLSFGQILQQRAYGTDWHGGFQLLDYLPQVASAIHICVSNESPRPPCAWPRRMTEVTFARKQKLNIAHTLMEAAGRACAHDAVVGNNNNKPNSDTMDVSSGSSSSSSTSGSSSNNNNNRREGYGSRSFAMSSLTSLVTDSVSMVCNIIAPHIRSVNQSILNPQEKEDISRTVAIMRSLGLSYQAPSGLAMATPSNNAYHNRDHNRETTTDIGPQLEPFIVALAEYRDPVHLLPKSSSSGSNYSHNKYGQPNKSIQSTTENSYYSKEDKVRMSEIDPIFAQRICSRLPFNQVGVGGGNGLPSDDPLRYWLSPETRRSIYLMLREEELRSGAVAGADASSDKAIEKKGTRQIDSNKSNGRKKSSDEKVKNRNLDDKATEIKVDMEKEMKEMARVARSKMDFFLTGQKKTKKSGKSLTAATMVTSSSSAIDKVPDDNQGETPLERDKSSGGVNENEVNSKSNSPSGVKRSSPEETDQAINKTNHSVGSSDKHDLDVETKRQRVMYKFTQGFSNAVRRPVSISDFL